MPPFHSTSSLRKKVQRFFFCVAATTKQEKNDFLLRQQPLKISRQLKKCNRQNYLQNWKKMTILAMTSANQAEARTGKGQEASRRTTSEKRHGEASFFKATKHTHNIPML